MRILRARFIHVDSAVQLRFIVFPLMQKYAKKIMPI